MSVTNVKSMTCCPKCQADGVVVRKTFVPNPNDICKICEGQGYLNTHLVLKDQDFCQECDGCGAHFHNPLLEEYVDCVHFFLSIAIQKNWLAALRIYAEQLDSDGEFDGGLTGIFLEMTYFLNKSYFEHPNKEKDDKFKTHFGFPQNQYWFRTAWILFLNIGINGFGFTPEQIEEAYFAKNAVNHARQDSGVY